MEINWSRASEEKIFTSLPSSTPFPLHTQTHIRARSLFSLNVSYNAYYKSQYFSELSKSKMT